MHGISLAVEREEMLGIIGPNGAGKTTLLNCISGVLPLSGGRIFFDGERIDSVAAHKAAGRGIARTFQIAESFRSFSSWTMSCSAGMRGGPDRSGFARPGCPRCAGLTGSRSRCTESLIEKYKLAEFRHSLLRELPYGHQKLADIVRAVAAEPSLLLLDEPTSGSSAEERLMLREVMHELRAEKISTSSSITKSDHLGLLLAGACHG